MKTIKRLTYMLSATLIAAILLPGCSATSKVAKDTGSSLTYKLDPGKSLTYLQSSTAVQTVTYMGQEMGATINSSIGFQVSSTGSEEGVLDLSILVDTLGVNVQSPQGNFKSSIDELIGKKFSMKLSQKGKESHTEEAAKLKYSVAGQETNLEPSFKMMFPDVPEGSVKIGSTWTDNDTINLSSGTETSTMVMKSENTIAAIEEMNGYRCIVIKAVITGVRDGGSDTPQGYISTSGKITGESTVYFAIDEGLLVKDHTKVNIDGYISIPTGESLPLIIETEYHTELVGK
jgi:hypothetical protein